MDALADWQNTTCLQFRPATDEDINKVLFTDGAGCSSKLGMVGGAQNIVLRGGKTASCRMRGLYLHEVGHAIGLVHEHQLPQRDDYITINFTNVRPEMLHEFKTYDPEVIDTMGVEYEYESIMHYGTRAFSANKKQTFAARDKDKEYLIGHVYSKGLAFSDVKVVNLLYKCNAKCKTKPDCESPCFVNHECKCICKADIPAPPDTRCINKLGKDCERRAKNGECEDNPRWTLQNCGKACGMCPTDRKDTTTTQGR
ncbi:hypothetical protein ACOMHN_015391 [Nucella lapillus]